MTTSIEGRSEQAVKSDDSATPGQINLAGKRIHFVGIGGCGMSGLALIVRSLGAVGTGSDLGDSATVDMLRRQGFEVMLEQNADSVPPEVDIMVISAAIRADHPEVEEARRRGIPVLKYSQMLGQLMIGRVGIAIAGTHGKSTTTSLLSHVLIQCGLDPSLIVGANCRQIGGGSRVGTGDLLVAEACEYDRSFHNFHHTHGIILNVEEDHLDLYKGIDEIVESFAVFARKLPRHGSLLINHEMPHRLAICAGLECAVETIGFAPQADWQVEVAHGGDSTAVNSATAEPPMVRIYHRGELVTQWLSPLPGDHMAYNAAAAAAMAHRLAPDIAWESMAAAVASFTGLDRRMQRLGIRKVPRGVVTVIDDYGHHPTEVDTTLRALRRHYHPKRLVCVFQPHQHSRTRFLLDQFAASFSAADLVIVPHIYFSRDSEVERRAVSAGDLVDRLRKRGRQAMHLYPFEAIVEQLQIISRPGDLVVTMGAGDVWKIAHEFLIS